MMVVRIAVFAMLWVVAGCNAASSGSPGESPEGAVPSTDVAGSLAPASLQPSPDPIASPAASSGSPGESPEVTVHSPDVPGPLAPASLQPSPDPTASPRLTDVPGSLAPASLQPSPDPTAGPGPIDLPARIIDPIVADIARLAAVPVNQVTVQSAEFVTFPDAGLGCPVLGMAYTQVQVDGYKIVGVAAGTIYDYRGTGPGKFRLCSPQK